METCANCSRQIGNLETPHLFKDKVVCGDCIKRLAPEPLPYAAVTLRKRISPGRRMTVTSLVMLAVGLLSLVIGLLAGSTNFTVFGVGFLLFGIGLFVVGWLLSIDEKLIKKPRDAQW